MKLAILLLLVPSLALAQAAPGTVTKDNGSGGVTDTEFPIVDGPSSLAIGNDTGADALTINGRAGITSTLPTAHALSVNLNVTGETTNAMGAINALHTGTVDTTGASLWEYGLMGQSLTTRSAGGNPLVDVGVYGYANGSDGQNLGGFFLVQCSGCTHSYGLNVNNHSSASSLNAGVHINEDGVGGGAHYGLIVGSTNGRAIDTERGNNVFNVVSGFSQFNGDTILGVDNLDKQEMWGHVSVRGSAPTASVGCSVVGTDRKWTVTAGAGTTLCAITWSRTENSTTTCIVTPRDGVSQSYDPSSSGIMLVTNPGSAYDGDCACVGGGACR